MNPKPGQKCPRNPLHGGYEAETEQKNPSKTRFIRVMKPKPNKKPQRNPLHKSDEAKTETEKGAI
jgi:hypothetical protein